MRINSIVRVYMLGIWCYHTTSPPQCQYLSVTVLRSLLSISFSPPLISLPPELCHQSLKVYFHWILPILLIYFFVYCNVSETIWHLSSFWLILLNIAPSNYIHALINDNISRLFFYLHRIPLYVCINMYNFFIHVLLLCTWIVFQSWLL